MSDTRTNHLESRKQPKGSLDYFPTPPWATRALIHELLIPHIPNLRTKTARDPACGGGHMLPPLREAFSRVGFSDVADWGINPPIRDFTFETLDSLIMDGVDIPDWIITNPPYEIANTFFERAYGIARDGIALLLRLGWVSGQDRYHRIFGPTPPTFFCPFSERVAMIEGAWDPEASTATDYAWFVWVKGSASNMPGPVLRHFRPGMARLYSRISDMELAKPGEAKRRAKERKDREALEKASAA